MHDDPITAQLPDDAFIRLDEVLKRIPVSKSSYYAGMGTLYPPLVKIGPRARAVRLSSVKAWIADPEGWQRENRTVNQNKTENQKRVS